MTPRMIWRAAALLLALASPLHAEINIQPVTSPGGIKAWLVEDHGIPFTALEIRFKGGTSLDASGKRGAVNLMTALIEEGAGDLDSQGFAAARDGLAASFHFSSDQDGVSVSSHFLTENRDQALALLHDALTKTRWTGCANRCCPACVPTPKTPARLLEILNAPAALATIPMARMGLARLTLLRR